MKIDPNEVSQCISSALPAILARFAQAGHRSVRINLVVESMDPFPDAGPPGEIPLAMVPLATVDPRTGES